MAKRKLPYTRGRYSDSKSSLLKEAKRLRATGRYNAKVLKSRKPYDSYKWTMWTQRISDKP